MPAKSAAQQKAAGQLWVQTISEEQLWNLAHTKRKGKADNVGN